VVVRPPVRALEIGQERLAEKQLFDGLGIEVAPYAAVDTLEGLEAAAQVIGLPVVAKTRRFGYDGKGQAVIREPREIEEAWIHLGGRPLLVERLVRFTREVSILAVRAPNGALATYPLVENHHAQGILRLSLAPAPGTSPALEAEARRIAEQVAEALDHVGVLAVELFEVDGRLLANELAPRVHNSGHWTIEGAETSQFENHVRAVLGLPLGSVRATRPTAMVNLISELPATEALLAVPGAHVHLYGKAPKPGRKLGHVTVVADDARTLVDRLEMLGRLVPLPREPLERLAGR
jgi:5-(carboxyamino)imidazole ribonucleotide synthase